MTAYASRRAATSRCLDRVTVQLFGAAPVLAAPATRDALLRAVVATLERCVVGRHPMNDPRTDERTGKTPTNAYRSPLASFDPADEAARHRLFARPCNDLRMLLSRRDAARRWLYGGARSPFFRSAIKTLAALAGMHAYRHKKGEHVLRESRAWIEAVTAETFVCSTFRAGVACVGDGLAGDKRAPPGRASSQNENENENASGTRFEDVTALLDARDALLDACADWHAGFVRHELRDETGSLRSNERLLSDLHASPVSMHVPLHRLWAVAAHWAAAARASLKKGGENKDTENKSVCFADAETCRRIRQQAVHPLRALAFAEQVTHRVWVRNGEEIRRAAGVYASRYAAGVGRDADFGFAQMALVAFVEEDEQRRTLLLHETQSLDVVRFVLAVGSAGAVAPARENAAAFPFPLANDGLLRSVETNDRVPTETNDIVVCRTTNDRVASDDTSVTMDVCEMDLSDDERQRQSSAFCRLIELYPDPSSLPVGALACARATARLLVSLTRDRAWLTREPFESRCRREVVHQLAACGRSGVTFSALAERLPAAVAAEADVERALARVAVRRGTLRLVTSRRVPRAARRTRCETTSGCAPKAASTPSSTGTPGASTTPRSPRRRGYGCEASGNGNEKPPRERTPTTERTPPRFHPTDRHLVNLVPVPVPEPSRGPPRRFYARRRRRRSRSGVCCASPGTSLWRRSRGTRCVSCASAPSARTCRTWVSRRWRS